MKIENSEIENSENAVEYAQLALKLLAKRDAEAEAEAHIEHVAQMSNDYQQLFVLRADIEKLHAQVREVAARICVYRTNTDLLMLKKVGNHALHETLYNVLMRG